MTNSQLYESCPACESSETLLVIEYPKQPVHVGFVYDSKATAIAATPGNIELRGCLNCGFAWNRSFDPSLISFQPGYDASLAHSLTYRKHLDQTSRRLVNRYRIRQQVVFDIGCGHGEFLQSLCNAGENRGIGIDPTQTYHVNDSDEIEFRSAFYCDRQSKTRCDFICCVSVLEDIHNLTEFLDRLRQQCGENQCIAYLEVFNAETAFRHGETWTIHYEQCNYFSRSALHSILARHGFKLLEISECFGGQYLSAEVLPITEISSSFDNDRPQFCPITYFESFRDKHLKNIADWNVKLSMLDSDLPVGLWGSGGRGITFLNAVESSHMLDFVIDINPQKTGKYVPGTGHRIVHPIQLNEICPGTILVSNPNYLRDIRQNVNDLGLACEVLCI